MEGSGSLRVNKTDAILKNQLNTIKFDDKRNVLSLKSLNEP